MTTLKFILRIVIGSIFIVSSILKQISFSNFCDSIDSYGIFPLQIIRYIALFICLLELIMGIMIIFDIYGKIAIKITLGFMFAMVIFVGFGVFTNKNWVCNCFGSFFEQKITYLTFIRNIIILILTYLSNIYFSDKFAFDKIKSRSLPYILIFLITVTGPILNKIYAYNNQPLKEGDSFIYNELYDLNKMKINLMDRKEKYLLVFALKTTDCASCIEESSFWNEFLEESSGIIKPILIIDAENEFAIKRFAEERKLKMTIIYDKESKIISTLNVNTPVKILLNNDNTVMNIHRSFGEELYFNKYKSKIKEIIDKTTF